VGNLLHYIAGTFVITTDHTHTHAHARAHTHTHTHTQCSHAAGVVEYKELTWHEHMVWTGERIDVDDVSIETA
jgi:hypothetical protein